MASFFAGWSPSDIVGSLNRSEVRAALLDHDIAKGSFRSWNSIEQMILEASDDVKNILYQSVLVKGKIKEQHHISKLKRKLEQQMMLRNV